MEWRGVVVSDRFQTKRRKGVSSPVVWGQWGHSLFLDRLLVVVVASQVRGVYGLRCRQPPGPGGRLLVALLGDARLLGGRALLLRAAVGRKARAAVDGEALDTERHLHHWKRKREHSFTQV
ncbi:hypothetical protein AVEN_135643-1 [Araneus ventricosus]|uniref:Uncharacterized protein n=1 Tax=Araneus ventricosus TaxID=182803 RepID=A0A4Y2EKF5_ARAVE|nr:hypothetical protein AVEN_135643-1 [Araneus ventricosus]